MTIDWDQTFEDLNASEALSLIKNLDENGNIRG